jgi:transposase
VLACAGRGGQRHDISHQLWRFYDWCARVNVPEVITLAETVQAWWPEILAFLQLGITNADTEGTNRLIKQVKRHACGFRNEQHSATASGCIAPTTEPGHQRDPADCPPKVEEPE